MKYYAIVFVILILVSPWVQGAIIHVPDDQPTIQAGIAAADPGDTVLVGDGLYTGPGNRDIDFGGKSITVQSESGWSACVIDCQGTSAENHRGFVFQSGETAAAVLTGFTIINGYSDSYGGAMYFVAGSSPSISHCMIMNSSASSGAGVFCWEDASPHFLECGFQENQAESYGGAIRLVRSSAVFEECVITRNSAQHAGGVVLGSPGSPVFRNCDFDGNSAAQNGGAMYIGGNTEPGIYGCVFHGNTARHLGGAIYFDYQAHPTVGGSEPDGNYFYSNHACSGMDLAAYYYEPDPLYNLTWNTFAGHLASDYYVSPPSAFNLANCTAMTPAVLQDVFVTTDGSDTNDGLTWNTAFRTMSHALASIGATDVDPVTIHIGPGIFSPSTTGELFPLPVVNFASVSGAGMPDTILNAESSDRLFYALFDNSVTVSDLTIQGGESSMGGGVYIRQSDLQFVRCRFHANHSLDTGGGVYISAGSDPLFRSCLFSDNIAETSGGAMVNFAESDTTLIDCVMSGNTALQGSGGAYYNEMFGFHLFDRCMFTGNTAGGSGGGVFLGSKCVYGTITRCEFLDNSAGNNGGGIYAGWDVVSDFQSCLFAGNSAQANGGGLFFSQELPAAIQNTTITGNTALNGGGIYCQDDIDLTVTDCILWGDSPDEIAGDLTGTVVLTTDIQGGFTGSGNIDEDPCFTPGTFGVYYLSQQNAGQPLNSPCLDAGSDAASLLCFDTPDGEVCMDDLSTRTDHALDTGLADMGYHYTVLGVMTPTPSATPPPTIPPTVTPTNLPSETPTASSTPDPSPAPTDTRVPPTGTPTPNPATPTSPPAGTPTPECNRLGTRLLMPDVFFRPGNPCGCSVFLCNPESQPYEDLCLFVILDIHGLYLFAPSFGSFDFYPVNALAPGEQEIIVIPGFTFPAGAGTVSGIRWYAGLTDAAMSTLIGDMDTWVFGWGV